MNYTELDWRWAVLLGSALQSGLLEAVANGPRTSGEVARKLGLDGRAVHVVLSALEELGVLGAGTSGFWLPEEHRGPLLRAEHPDYVGQSVVHRFELIAGWSRLPEILRTGEPAEDRTAPGFGGTATFIAAMRREAAPGAEAVATSVLARLPDRARILDVGGGPGTNAEAFARGGARVTVFDLPGVIDLMQSTLHAAGVETTAGDMNETLPDGPFDAVYFGNTSHMYGPRENRDLFARMRGPLAPGGLLAIREQVRGRGGDAALFAVNMLVTTARGNTYAEGEYRDWLARAGYEGVEFEAVPGRTSDLIFARNPVTGPARA